MAKKEWCRKTRTELDKQSSADYNGQGKPRWVRCPDCGKRLKTYWRNCVGDLSFHQACCWWEYMPPHKKIVSKKKGSRDHAMPKRLHGTKR